MFAIKGKGQNRCKLNNDENVPKETCDMVVSA